MAGSEGKMKDIRKFNGKTLNMYTNNLTAGIFKNINIIKQALEKDNFPIGFTEKDINIITNELLYYFLNICDRFIEINRDYFSQIKEFAKIVLIR